MNRKHLARAAAAALSSAMLGASPAIAHDSRLHDDGAINSGKETHYHDHAQHGVDEGHLPATSDNVRKIGNLDLFAGAEQGGASPSSRRRAHTRT